MRLGVVEIFLIQIIIYAGIYLWDPYIGLLITVIMSAICFAILILSIVMEWIERSNISRFYFKIMIASIIAPVIVLAFFSLIDPEAFDWLDQ